MKLETLKQSLHFPGYLYAWNTSSLCSCVGTVDRRLLLIKTVVCTRFRKGNKKCKRSVSDLLLLSFSSNWFYSWLSMWYLFLAKNKNSLFLHPRLILGRCLGAPFALHWIGALFSGNGSSRGHPTHIAWIISAGQCIGRPQQAQKGVGSMSMAQWCEGDSLASIWVRLSVWKDTQS